MGDRCVSSFLASPAAIMLCFGRPYRLLIRSLRMAGVPFIEGEQAWRRSIAWSIILSLVADVLFTIISPVLLPVMIYRLLVQFAKSSGERPPRRDFDDRRGGDRYNDRGGYDSRDRYPPARREKPSQGWRCIISNLPQGVSWQVR